MPQTSTASRPRLTDEVSAHPKEPIVLAGTTFPTKKAAKKAVQDMVAFAILDRPLTGEFHRICCDLISRHPRSAEKAGCGVLYFHIVEQAGLKGRQCSSSASMDPAS